MNIPAVLRDRLVQAAGGGALALAAVMVTHFEGMKHYPYRDPIGVITVCIGHTGPDIIWGRYYSTDECYALRDRDLLIAEAAVDRNARQPMSKYQKAALIDFTFNVGEGRLRSSTLLALVNARKYDAACLQYRRWVYAAGTKLKGLVVRRNAEQWVCEGMS